MAQKMNKRFSGGNFMKKGLTLTIVSLLLISVSYSKNSDAIKFQLPKAQPRRVSFIRAEKAKCGIAIFRSETYFERLPSAFMVTLCRGDGSYCNRRWAGFIGSSDRRRGAYGNRNGFN